MRRGQINILFEEVIETTATVFLEKTQGELPNNLLFI